MLTQNEREWIGEQFNDLRKELVNVRIDIAQLKVKARVWGMLGGLIPVLAMMCLYILTTIMKG
uniref:Uncharacterized protein n=1 Tax=viral metagenome TaxID=1070528 RepID=A0A6M3KSB5_9ZZZZ